ncbi:hypothetical protein BH11MYX4_BH11MYX4_53060 [soil metagenome]|nr:hypothetical protein [Labilithrix sp.]
MQIKKFVALFVTAAVFPFALLGCPDKAAETTKPDPAASAKPATTGAAASAAPAKSGAGW